MKQPSLDIRPGMDVYNEDQTRYLGCVVTVAYVDGVSGGPQENGSNPTGSVRPAHVAPMVHEQDRITDSLEHAGKHTLGEELGPVASRELGNAGPQSQSAGNIYATHPTAYTCAAVSFTVRPGRLNFGRLTPTREYFISAVRSISMERIVVSESS